MCGIAGIISKRTNIVSQQSLQKMTDAIKHRGPEGEGFWINNNGIAALGHRRLSIIDLSPAGAQPMHYQDRYTITYNGELYNYIELRDQLKSKKFSFSSDSDTEVILAAYAFYGKDCLRHFDGMFAFAIWDELEQTLFCARDRFGEKPFYYYEGEDRFLFGSEMKALWAAGAPKKMNNTMLLNYLTIGYTSDPTLAFSTFYDDISTLPPANYMVLKMLPPNDIMDYEFEIFSYWDLDKETQSAITDEKAIETFSHLFQTSIKRRLRSDVPVGTSLSGGLDSSSIVATINKSHPTIKDQQTAFSAIFSGFEKDESRQIRLVSQQFNIKNFTVTPTAEGLVQDFKKLQHHQEEPFQSSSIYAQYKVYELAKEHGVTVLLDGQGADEILAGYHKYYHWYWQELLAKRDWSMFKKEKQDAKALGANVEWSAKNYIAAFFPLNASEALTKRAIKNQKSHPAIAKDFFNAYKNEPILYKPVIDKLNDILYYNTSQQGLQELLRYADRNSMAHSREVRLPFLNHELVQFIFSLPPNFKIRNGFTKWILREAMTKTLPKEITWRKDKVGFEPPQQSWMKNKRLQDYIHESKKKLVSKGILKKDSIDKPINPLSAHSANNFDWRYLSAAECM
jgi:asparagine synthase (glutamine-hydrolysing)